MQIEPSETILFIGDSITDAGREKQSGYPNDPTSLGEGFAKMAAGQILLRHPSRRLRIFNRGISGNKITDLADRWQTDCLDLEPTLLNILIGVNDTWHAKGGGAGVPLVKFETIYKQLLDQTKQTLPSIKLVLCQPFALPIGAVDETWYPEFTERQAIVTKLAEQYGASYVPFQSMFDELVNRIEASYWMSDGVHPTLAGHTAMAGYWLDTVLG